MFKLYKFIMILILILLNSCSVFKDSTMPLTIQSDLNSQVYINDNLIKSPIENLNVQRDIPIHIMAFKEGYKPYYITLNPKISLTGKLDTLGVYFLFPGIGLFSPGYYDIEKDSIYINFIK